MTNQQFITLVKKHGDFSTNSVGTYGGRFKPERWTAFEKEYCKITGKNQCNAIFTHQNNVPICIFTDFPKPTTH